MMVTFLVCHMIGISSACTNPVLYGFLNDNFVKVNHDKNHLLLCYIISGHQEIISKKSPRIETFCGNDLHFL